MHELLIRPNKWMEIFQYGKWATTGVQWTPNSIKAVMEIIYHVYGV